MSTNHDTCFHCGLENSFRKKYPVKVNGRTEYMCCPGCQAVCESIISLGLTDYYQFRENLPETSPRDMETELEELNFYDHEKVQKKYVTLDEDNLQHIDLMVNGIVCAACTWLIESRLSKLNGISKITVNQSTSRATLSWDPEFISLSSILKAINQLGYEAYPYDKKIHEQHLIDEKKRSLQRLAVAGLGMMQVMMLSLGFYMDPNQEMSESTSVLLRWVSLLVSTPVVFYAGSPFYLSAFKSIRNFTVNMDVPVTLAISSAWVASAWSTIAGHGEIYFDSVSMFIFFLLTGRYLQMISIHRSWRVFEERLKSKPETAIRLIEGEQERILLDDVLPGYILLVKPGQQIPCDGVIETGETTIDESILTGESLPLLQKVGDKVASGSINTGNVITVKVTNSAENSTLTGIINLLQKAQQTKPKVQLLADKVASYFVVMVLLLAFSTGVFWYWHDSSQLFNAVLAVLVVTCPCALSLATPVAITAGLGKLTEQALLINRTAALLNLSELTDVIFDKTGTLTTNRFSVASIDNFSEKSDDEILQIIAMLESHSDHPIASAFSDIENNFATKVIDVSILPASGIEAKINEERWEFGNASMLGKLKCPIELPAILAGQLMLFLIKSNQCQALIVLETEIRDTAKVTIEQLKAKGLNLHLLSGDQEANVKQIANELGFDGYLSEQSPEQKLSYIQKLQKSGSKAAMVGDGINDSPAMAASLVSVAMAKSTDITKVSADIIMLSDDLNLINDSIDTSKAVRGVIKQNLMWALSYNLFGLPLAMSGILTPWLAALGMSVSSLVVVLNALRLSRKS